MVYWVTAEPVILLLGSCLPGSVQLGRRLMNTYVSPMLSKVSLSLRSTRSAGSRGGESGPGSGMESLKSTDSLHHQMIVVSPHQDSHKVDVRVGTATERVGFAVPQVPGRGIRVDNDVSVV